jgi:dGTPase
MKTPYASLLTPNRFRSSTVTNRDIVAEAESDRGRLLFCAAFRRLQQKAQVFSMEPNAAVRSRLTHSFEVSQMGRYIADLIAKSLIERSLATEDECTALVTFVETACLMHDIGNPPFGHFGEAAIAKWFREKGEQAIIEACNTGVGSIGTTDPRLKAAIADFLEFDGNPQGLRVVAKLQRNTDEFGLNLTKTTIASYLKYVRGSGADAASLTSPFTKKCGYFQTESDIVQQTWEHFGYAEPRRFPLAYVMEAADDLAYCISDLEDSIEKGLLNQSIALSEIFGQWRATSKAIELHPSFKNIDQILQKAAAGQLTYTDFRTALNRDIVEYCAGQYIDNHEQVGLGTLPSLMTADSPAGHILNLLKEYCRNKVYCHESVQRTELAGYNAIYGLLEIFKCLLTCGFDRFECSLDYSKNKDSTGRQIVVEKKLLTLFPKNYIKVYFDDLSKLRRSDDSFEFREWALRAHLVTDFLSGMTDDFAMSTYRTLSGMRL